MTASFLAHVGHDHAAHHWMPFLLLLTLATFACAVLILRRVAREARRGR